MPSAAFSTSASSKTITGALPPSSRWTRLRSVAAAPATSMPARTEPVIATICGVGCCDQRAAGVAVAADDVEHARRQELLADLGQQRRGGRRGVARLEDDGVAGGQRRGDLPDHHHQRVVPRRHLADDADRLAADARRVVLHVLPGRPALEHPGGAGEEAEVVDASAASPRWRSGRAACRCPCTRPRRSPRRGTRWRRRSCSSACARSFGVVRPRTRRPLRRRRRRGRRPRRRTAGRGRRPRRWSGRRRRTSRRTRRRRARRR